MAGVEFVVVMPGTGLMEVIETAEKLRGAGTEQRFAPDEEMATPLTVSAGLAATGGRAVTAEQLLHAADEAPHAVKRAGRNRKVRAVA